MVMNKKRFQNYVPGESFAEAFETGKVPILQMQHLRNLDFPISRHISIERTVDEFLTQLTGNDSLSALKNRRDMVVLLNEEGALIREAGKWSLLFTPDLSEGNSLPEDADLYPVLQSLLKKQKEGTVCSVEVPHRSMKALAEGSAPFRILDEYCAREPGGYLAVAERIVFAGPDELYAHVPVCRYGKLITVDRDEIESYQTIRALLDDYLVQCDAASGSEPVQPLSIAVFGPPGAGKSFGVKQIAQAVGRYHVTSLNISQFYSPEELFESLDEALKCSKDEVPLIFFDEFDSELEGTPRGWLKYFLAPMQDGEYTMKGRTRSIDSAVFVFAGGTAASFPEFLPKNKKETETFARIKGPDFVSRLKGVLSIKGLNPVSPTDRSHIIRRAILLREQIIRRVPGIYNEEGGLINISRGLLSALLRVSEYRHGARSLEFILAMCRLSDVKRFTPSCLPMDDQLDIHLDVRDFQHKLAFEQLLGDLVETYARIAHENYVKRHLPQMATLPGTSVAPATTSEAVAVAAKNAAALSMSDYGVAAQNIAVQAAAAALSSATQPSSLANDQPAADGTEDSDAAALTPQSAAALVDPQLADWDHLSEIYKESYRSQIRYLGESLEDYDAELGIRPVVPGAPDALSDLYGPILEKLAEMEHDRWMRDKIAAGWSLGRYDPELRLTPELVPYSELESSRQEFIRREVREVPAELREIGYELYVK